MMVIFKLSSDNHPYTINEENQLCLLSVPQNSEKLVSSFIFSHIVELSFSGELFLLYFILSE